MSGGPGGYGDDYYKNLKCQHCGGKVYLHGQHVNHDACARAAFEHEHPHVCPKCTGKGTYATQFTTRNRCCATGGPPMYGGHGGLAGCEYCPKMISEQVPVDSRKCDLCEGKGRLKTKPIPITETKTIGWKRGDKV